MYICVYMYMYMYIAIFIGKRRIWKGGFPHLETKAKIMGVVVKFK